MDLISSVTFPEPDLIPLDPPTTIGRPLSLTYELTERVANLVCEGHYIVTACAALGLGRTNYYRWCRQGEQDDEAGRETPEALFWHTVKTAEAQGEIRIGREWLKGGKDWPAYATWNERKAPERWARRSEGQDGPKVVVQIGVSAAAVDRLRVSIQEPSATQPLTEGDPD